MIDTIGTPQPRFVVAADGVRIATYEWGDAARPAVFLVHGFGSGARDNWVDTGWIPELLSAGLRIVAVDLRGHGRSDKPHDPSAYNLPVLINDLGAVLDAYALTSAAYVGYSLGGRLGWHLAASAPERITRCVLGGIPDGRVLRHMRLDEARAHVLDGTPIKDPATRRYLALIERLPENDETALLAFAEGMLLHPDIATRDEVPSQPTLLVVGAADPIAPDARELAEVLPNGRYFEVPRQNHMSTPSSPRFRTAALEFLVDAQASASDLLS